MKIIKLISENVRKLKAVEIIPKTNIVEIQGKNGQGKSSVIDSIFYALGGKDALPPEPINNDSEKANIKIDLGEYVVEKHIYKSNGTLKHSLKVTNKDGASYPSPQTFINNLISNLAYDPIAFERMEAKEQVKILKQLINLDTSEREKKIEEIKEKRKFINYKKKDIEVKLRSLTEPEYNLPNEVIDITLLKKALNNAHETINDQNKIKNNLLFVESKKNILKEEIEKIEKEITELKNKLAEKNKELQLQKEEHKIAKEQYEKTSKPDIVSLQAKIEETELLNSKIRHKQEYAFLQKSLDDLHIESEMMTMEINNIKESIEEEIKNAEYPSKGLEVKDVIYFNGIPFEQCSSSERLLISLSIVESLNNKLKICLIRDGSLLDNKNKRILVDWAKKKDIQIWFEEVKENKEDGAFYIEEGEIV